MTPNVTEKNILSGGQRDTSAVTRVWSSFKGTKFQYWHMLQVVDYCL